LFWLLKNATRGLKKPNPPAPTVLITPFNSISSQLNWLQSSFYYHSETLRIIPYCRIFDYCFLLYIKLDGFCYLQTLQPLHH
jgi:glycopeptide antibiotics resistance protein